MEDIQSSAKTVRGPYRSRLRPTPRQTSYNKRRRTEAAIRVTTTAEAATPDHLQSQVSSPSNSLQESQVSSVLPTTNDTAVTELTNVTEPAMPSIDSSEGYSDVTQSDDQAVQVSTNCCSSDNDDSELSMAGSKPKLYHGSILTVDTSCLLVDCFVNRYHLSSQCKEDLLRLMHLHIPSDNQLPPSLHKFKQASSSMTEVTLDSTISEHFYCHKCYTPLKNDKEKEVCPNVDCGFSFDSQLHSFVTLPISTQIQLLMKRPGLYQSLKRPLISSTPPSTISDIYDGEVYRSIALESPNDSYITLILNTDGAEIFKSTKVSMWPMLLMINELQYSKRKLPQNMLLGGLWCANEKPNLQMFLQPVIEMLLDLEITGVEIHPPGADKPFNIKVYVIGCTCDLPARALVLNAMQFNGAYGCSFCKQPGVTTTVGSTGGHVHTFPYNKDDPKGPARTRAGCAHDAMIARKDHSVVNGIKGPSWLMTLEKFDFGRGISPEYMHCALLGVSKLLLNLWTDTSRCKNTAHDIHSDVSLLNQRIKKFQLFSFCTQLISKRCQVPSDIRHKPREIDELKNWKASEFRSWTLYYAIPVLEGVLDDKFLKHFVKFSEALWLLLQSAPTTADIDRAENLLIGFCKTFSRIYGDRYCTANVHQLLHFCDAVRYLGPLWAHSCFPFENANGWIRQLYNGTRNPEKQIVKRFIERQKLAVAVADRDKHDDDAIDNFFEKMLTIGHRYHISAKVGPGHLALGEISTLRDLTSCEIAAVRELHPALQLEEAVIYKRVLLKGVLHTNLFYRQSSATTTNDYTVMFKDGTIGRAIKYLSCASTHVVLAYPFQTKCYSRSCSHIHRVLHSVNFIKAYNTAEIVAKCCLQETFISVLPNSYEKDM